MIDLTGGIMYYYNIAGTVLESSFNLSCEPADAEVVLESTEELPPPGADQRSGSIVHRNLSNRGWFFHSRTDLSTGLYVNNDYTRLRLLGAKEGAIPGISERFIRIAMECRLARKGYVSLHAAAVEIEGNAYAFSGPSGIGKSTRANSWIEALDSNLINGDRPLINVIDLELYGVPWDGKEKCYRNVHYPLETICEVRRSDSVYIRSMSFQQKRKLLLRQCFIAMWDTETAIIQMANISKLAANAKIVRAFCGPTTEDAQALYNALKEHQYFKEEQDMKAVNGFVLRNVVDEYILMPKGDNIGKFNGTILMNEVSAFV